MKLKNLAALIVPTLLVLVTGMLLGCYSPTKSAIHVKVIVYDACQYLEATGYNGYKSYTHKGNCTNAVHGHRVPGLPTAPLPPNLR